MYRQFVHTIALRRDPQNIAAKRFRNFFDYEKELRNVKEKKHKKSDPRFAGISKLLKRGE